MTDRAPSAPISSLIVMAIGIGCYLGWHLVDISPTLFAAPLDGVSTLLDIWSVPATAVSTAALLVLGILSYRRPFSADAAPFVTLISLIASLSTALLYVAGWLAPRPIGLLVVTARLLMALSAVFVVFWGEMLCRVRFRDVLGCVSAGYATAFVICLLVACLETRAAMIFRSVLPLISGAMLLSVNRDAHQLGYIMSTGQLRSGARLPLIQSSNVPKHLPWNLFVGIGVFGAILTIANHLSETKSATSTEIYTLIAGVTVSFVLLLIAGILRTRDANFTLLYRLVTPLVVAALLLTLCLQPGYQRYEALAIGVAWVFFRIFTWTMWTHIGARESMSPAIVFATGQVILYISSTIAEMFCRIFNPVDMPLTLAASAIILAAVLTSALLMGEGSLAHALGRTRDEECCDDDCTRSDEIGIQFALAMPEAKPQSARKQNGVASKQDAIGTAGSRTEAPSGMAATGADNSEINLKDVTANAVAASQRWGLSGREIQIALLVLAGISNAGIASAACITESTLRTHLRNIYAKAGVHSHDELIDAMTRGDDDNTAHTVTPQ